MNDDGAVGLHDFEELFRWVHPFNIGVKVPYLAEADRGRLEVGCGWEAGWFCILEAPQALLSLLCSERAVMINLQGRHPTANSRKIMIRGNGQGSDRGIHGT